MKKAGNDVKANKGGGGKTPTGAPPKMGSGGLQKAGKTQTVKKGGGQKT